MMKRLNMIPARLCIRLMIYIKEIEEKEFYENCGKHHDIQFRDGSYSDPVKQAKEDWKAFSVVLAFIGLMILAMMVFDNTVVH